MRLDKLAARIGCEVHGDSTVEIHGVATLDEARSGDITFLSNPRYTRKVAATHASAIIVARTFAEPVAIPTVRAGDPYLALAKALAVFHPAMPATPGIHPTAVIDPTAQVGPDANIGPYAVIGAGVRIGARASIAAHVVINANTEIGDDFVAHSHASVRQRVRIGHRVTLQDGAVIGGDGFGYAVGEDGTAHKMPQAGTVLLEDDVEIGANATIDRATVGATRVRRGTKIDNLVQIAHGCDVGEGCFLAAQVGLAGSTKLGKYVQLGGQTGAAGHLEIGDFVRAGGKTGITGDVPSGKTVAGFPAVEITTWRRASVALARLPELLRRVKRLEQALNLGSAAKE